MVFNPRFGHALRFHNKKALTIGGNAFLLES